MQRRKGTDGCGGPATTSPKMGRLFVCGAIQRAQPLPLPWLGAAWATAQQSEKSPGDGLLPPRRRGNRWSLDGKAVCLFYDGRLPWRGSLPPLPHLFYIC